MIKRFSPFLQHAPSGGKKSEQEHLLAFQFFTLPQQGKVGRRPFTNGIVIDLTQERGGGEGRGPPL